MADLLLSQEICSCIFVFVSRNLEEDMLPTTTVYTPPLLKVIKISEWAYPDYNILTYLSDIVTNLVTNYSHDHV